MGASVRGTGEEELKQGKERSRGGNPRETTRRTLQNLRFPTYGDILKLASMECGKQSRARADPKGRPASTLRNPNMVAQGTMGRLECGRRTGRTGEFKGWSSRFWEVAMWWFLAFIWCSGLTLKGLLGHQIVAKGMRRRPGAVGFAWTGVLEVQDAGGSRGVRVDDVEDRDGGRADCGRIVSKKTRVHYGDDGDEENEEQRVRKHSTSSVPTEDSIRWCKRTSLVTMKRTTSTTQRNNAREKGLN